MATERVVTGKKYRILSSVSDKVWDVISFFTKSSDVWNNNDKNLQTTVGSITGISSSLTSTSSTVAASAAAVKALNDKIVSEYDKWYNAGYSAGQSKSTLKRKTVTIPQTTGSRTIETNVTIKAAGMMNTTWGNAEGDAGGNLLITWSGTKLTVNSDSKNAGGTAYVWY